MSAHSVLMEPFDILLHATEEGVGALQARFATWLRTRRTPTRFICWQMPATLDDKINSLNRRVRTVTDPQRVALLTGYRRHYEALQRHAEYQRALCGIGDACAHPDPNTHFSADVDGNSQHHPQQHANMDTECNAHCHPDADAERHAHTECAAALAGGGAARCAPARK